MIGVLVSGDGSNLQAVIDDGLPVVAVASNKPGVRALERAEAAGIATAVFPLEEYATREERDAAMADWLEAQGVELVVCAGYMHLLRPVFLERFPGRIINTHPALLPSFRGAHPVEDALEAGVSETGATVHLVDEGVDSGQILLQRAVLVLPGDTVETLRERIKAVEHELLPTAIRLCLAGALGSAG
jgi:phosphoribosylglycinamide formyltransferase-1